ncbi:MAG: ABC transporter ATP-binding protein [Planctomycetota bacterium]
MNSTATQSTPALSASDLKYTYPSRRGAAAHDALRGLNCTIAPGEHVALLGPNGSGKSTFFRVLCGLLSPTAGSVDILGGPLDRARRGQLGVVFQHAGLDDALTVERNLIDHAVLYGMTIREARRRVDTMIESHALQDQRGRRVGVLSGGWKRRVDLCRALLHEPDVVLLDEPTVGLDPGARRQFLDQLAALRESSCTVLMSTHLIDEAERFDRVVLVHDGRIVADDTPAALRHALGDHRITVHDRKWQPDATSEKWVATPDGWMNTDAALSTNALAQHAERFIDAGIAFSIAPPTLDDAFIALTGTSLTAHEEASS